MARLLLVEDDPAIRVALIGALRELGHVVQGVSTGADGLRVATTDRPELVVLDLGLPDLDGWEVLRMLRGASTVPVIVATARDDDREVVRTLDAGADDYVVKPFTARQLDARVRAVLRRTGEGRSTSPVVVGGLEIDRRGRSATIDGRAMDLSVKEFDLLLYLAEHADEVVPKRELLSEVWRQPFGGADKTVDVHLSWLRRKLGESAQRPRYLHTVRGAGIRLSAPEG